MEISLGAVVLSHSEENGAFICEGDFLRQYVKAIKSGDKSTADALISGATKTGSTISACIEAALRVYETIKLLPVTGETDIDTDTYIDYTTSTSDSENDIGTGVGTDTDTYEM